MKKDKVKLGGVFERFGDMKVLGHFGIDGGILFVPAVYYGMQVSSRHGIASGE